MNDYYNREEIKFNEQHENTLQISYPKVVPVTPDSYESVFSTGLYLPIFGRIEISRYALNDNGMSLITTINHEELHKVLHRIEGFKTSAMYDKAIYWDIDRDYHGSTIDVIDWATCNKLREEKRHREEDDL